MGCGGSKTAPATETTGVPVVGKKLFKHPTMATIMQGALRKKMDASMHVTKHYNDCTYQEVQDFMVPSSVGNPFVDAPGTFDPNMKGRILDKDGLISMHRIEMEKGPAPHNLGITFAKFQEHRGYANPGYVSKAPQLGDVAPDGKILNLDPSQPPSTLLAEVKKLAEAKGSTKVIIAFEAITCPFFRAYAAEDLAKASNGVPTLHIYQREAEPCDVFDAGGMHCTSPIALKRRVFWHKTEADRRLVAAETQQFLETHGYGKGNVPMWCDTMDDTLEQLYESRPWRQYVIDANTGMVIAKLGLAPFNMAGKIKVIEEACRNP